MSRVYLIWTRYIEGTLGKDAVLLANVTSGGAQFSVLEIVA